MDEGIARQRLRPHKPFVAVPDAFQLLFNLTPTGGGFVLDPCFKKTGIIFKLALQAFLDVFADVGIETNGAEAGADLGDKDGVEGDGGFL